MRMNPLFWALVALIAIVAFLATWIIAKVIVAALIAVLIVVGVGLLVTIASAT